MKSIKSFFKSAFDIKKIADANLIAFTADHIQRLKDNNDNSLYNDLIMEIHILLEQYSKAIDKKIKITDKRKYSTFKVRFYFDKIKDAIRQLEAFLRSKYSKYSNNYQYLFPYGLSELSKLNQISIGKLLHRFHMFSKKHKNDVVEDTYNNISILFTEYHKHRKQQGFINKKLKYQIKSKNQIRQKLLQQLQKNIHILAIEFIDNSELGHSFFNEKLLFPKKIVKSKLTTKKQVS
jgi:hypothetical protein